MALALAPSAAGAATINIPTSCTLTGPGVCNATSLLASPGSPSDTIAFLGGVLTLNGAGKTYSQQATLSTTPTNILNQDSRNTTFSGVFSNATVSPGSIEIKNVNPGTGNPAAGGAVTFSAANTYTGTTTIDPGASLKLGATGSISNSAVVDNGALSIAADTSIPTLSGGGSVSLTGGGILTLSNASGIFSGIISGGGGVTIGGGSETLSGANTYTGATAIGAGGKLSISGSGSIAGSSNVDVANAGEFNIASASGDVSIKALTGAAGSSVMVGGNTLILTNAGNKTFSGTISGTGEFSVQKGTETFDTGAQKYTGLTTVSPAGTANATLKLSGTGDIGASSGVAVDSSGSAKGTFDIAGITASGTTIRTLAGSGNVNLGTKVLTLSNASGVFTGVISGSGTANGLTIAKGTESLMGANTFKGTTTVSAGATLQGTGSVVGPLVNNGTVRPLDPSTGSPGTFQAGKYTQSATGTLDIAIEGTPASGKYGQLSTTGKATLGGTLAVSLVDGFVIPTGSSTYDDVLTFTTGKSGDFTSFSFNGNSCSSGGAETWSCGFGLTFTEVFDADSLDLTVLSVATPEPGTLAVLASGLLGLLAWRRRRT